MPKKYIDAEDAKCIIEKLADELNKSSDINYVFALTDAILKIDDVPAADVEEVRHGKWKTTVSAVLLNNGELSTYYVFRCNVCKENANKRFLFCPNCGARMDGEENSDG